LTEIKNCQKITEGNIALFAQTKRSKIPTTMAMHTYAEMSSPTMRAGFPTPPEPTLGAHNLFILNYLLQYICKCAQTHKSTISKKMNLLYVVVDPGLYTHYSAGEAYPTNNYPFSDKVDEVPNFSVCNNNNNRATPKMTHAMLLKTRNNVVNMNAALIDTLVIGRLTMVLAGSLSRLKWRIMLKASHWSKQQWKLVT
jgi:hypothetical protein